MEKRLYSYQGPVLEFGRCVSNKWEGQTYAASPTKAKSNLAYQYKMTTGRVARTKIELPGALYCEGGN